MKQICLTLSQFAKSKHLFALIAIPAVALNISPALHGQSQFLSTSTSTSVSNSTDTSASSSSAASPETSSAEPSLSPAGGSTRGLSNNGVIAPARVGATALTKIAVGANVSPLGVGFMVATNLSGHLNFRADGSVLNYTVSNFTTQGFNVGGTLNMASARASLDYYPFHSGFRLSPGVMFYNQNKGTLNLAVMPGQSFTLNNQTYYSATGSRAVTGLGSFGLGNGSPAFTATTGWGNVIPHSGRHISFPFELGVAFIKRPTLDFNLSGYGCDASGVYCMNVATTPQIQENVAAQVQKYRNDIEPLHTYPIASFGVAYNFSIRRTSMYR